MQGMVQGTGSAAVNGDEWVEDYYRSWMYDQDLIDRANDELNTINQENDDAY